ncbi:PREDICTED: tumor suppressor candidate 2-like [Amphimedon queenslandica]|uniref:Tumor suppressor candidate 2 n=1 Tax=Amphimedon queenslandica TaxID=400682 RepID=A0A1X7VPV3_AMPQE|nr:PREDICTED: tumor suppressor candidate 2-like [Amphimedon queenslandica]|eukprot:XP_003383134.1 PREDICTED: tumor suppressor candidate 2-like [Amphimedon queenslandica]
MGGLLSGKKEDDKSGGEGERGKNAVVRPPFKCNPYVLKRTSSQYFDEDGDLAHSFYEECRVIPGEGPIRRTMRLLSHNGIRPQGEVALCHPRLHVDLPIILMENADL